MAASVIAMSMYRPHAFVRLGSGPVTVPDPHSMMKSSAGASVHSPSMPRTRRLKLTGICAQAAQRNESESAEMIERHAHGGVGRA